MDSLRLVEGKVKLELSRHIYNFMQAVSSYELLACEHDFKLTAPEVVDGKFKLLRPYIDKSVPLSSIREFAWVIGVDSLMHMPFLSTLLAWAVLNEPLLSHGRFLEVPLLPLVPVSFLCITTPVVILLLVKVILT